VVWVGSAGLASTLMEELVGPGRAAATGVPVPSGPILIVSGSFTLEAVAQVEMLRADDADDAVAVVAVEPAALAGERGRARRETARAAAELAGALACGRDALLHVSADGARATAPSAVPLVVAQIAEGLGASPCRSRWSPVR